MTYPLEYGSELWQPLFIIRGGQFGTDFTPKLVWIALGFALLIWEFRVRQQKDALWVFVAGVLLVGGMEGYLQLSGNRIMPERTLFGQALPLLPSLLVQAIAEGATIGLLGLFIGDRLLEPGTRRWGWVLLGVACLGILLREWQAAATLDTIAAYSRRNLLSPTSLLFLGVILLFNGQFYARRPEHRARMAGMGGVILLLAGLWTVAQFCIGVRWIEIPGATPGAFVRADLPATLAALAFSVTVEIALLLVTLYTLPAALGLIPAPE